MKKLSFILIAALVVLFTGCEKQGPSLDTRAKYTVIVYANGGENLDNYIEKDIANAAEFLSTKGDDYSVRMAVYMKYSSQKGLDGQANYTPGGKAGEVYGYEVDSECYKNRTRKDQYLALSDNWIIDHSDAPMFMPSYISSVLKDAAKNLPAENYILIVAGHANGWCVDEDGEYPAPNKMPTAAITDANYSKRAITAKELAAGIRQAGINVSTVVFDCCMQNSIEYLSELTDVPGLKYTLASGHTTHGGDYSDLISELFHAAHGEISLVDALSNYSETYAEEHAGDYEEYHDIVLMNIDFAVVDLAKLKDTWTPIKNIVDYLCANYKSADSAKYAIPARNCYQYYNKDSKYDLLDYLTLMENEGAPYENDAQYERLLTAVDDALDACILHHAYSLNYTDESAKPKDAAEKFVTISINLGAKGRLQDVFDTNGENYFTCYDYEGKPWHFYPSGATTWKTGDEQLSPEYNWTYSYDKSTFDQQTGWTRWLKLNPVMPYDNPPHGDDGDTNGEDDEDEEEE